MIGTRTLVALILPLASLAFAAAVNAQSPLPALRLWEGAAPGAQGDGPADIPDLTPYLPAPEAATGAAVVVLPGGGYGGLAPHEGADYALFLQQHGIAAFVVKYRLGSRGYRHPCMLNDAARALRIVRARAAEWKIDPARIGIMGSSAGGHLASTLLTHWDAGRADAADPVDRLSSRPDFGILCYAVISMQTNTTHMGSRGNLLGENPDPALADSLSNELQVRADTPPCFIWHLYGDTAVKVENSLLFASALSRSKVPFSLHVYEGTRHGTGLGDKAPFAHTHPWAGELLFWLKERKILPAAP